MSKIQEFCKLVKKIGYFFLSTADTVGNPHLAIARRIDEKTTGKVSVTSWFCLQSMKNLKDNKKAVLSVWDEEQDNGIQLRGESELVEEIRYAGGFSKNLEHDNPYPKVQWHTIINVTGHTRFSHAHLFDE